MISLSNSAYNLCWTLLSFVLIDDRTPLSPFHRCTPLDGSPVLVISEFTADNFPTSKFM